MGLCWIIMLVKTWQNRHWGLSDQQFPKSLTVQSWYCLFHSPAIASSITYDSRLWNKNTLSWDYHKTQIVRKTDGYDHLKRLLKVLNLWIDRIVTLTKYYYMLSLTLVLPLHERRTSTLGRSKLNSSFKKFVCVEIHWTYDIFFRFIVHVFMMHLEFSTWSCLVLTLFETESRVCGKIQVRSSPIFSFKMTVPIFAGWILSGIIHDLSFSLD